MSAYFPRTRVGYLRGAAIRDALPKKLLPER
jgi:hypothetical protein